MLLAQRSPEAGSARAARDGRGASPARSASGGWRQRATILVGVDRRRLDAVTVLRWLLVAAWLSLPFTTGSAVAAAVADRSEAVQRIDSTGAWLVWGAGLVAALVPTTVSLTAVRIVAPATLVAAVVAVAAGAGGATAVVGVAGALVVTLVALRREVGDAFVNGSSYGDERRFLLAPPGAVAIAPLPLAWVGTVAGVAAGPMLLAAGQWVIGGFALVVGWALAALLARALHGLSRRWLVFVPAGLVVHDQSTLVESAMVQRREVASMSRALAGTQAHDLTAGALGGAVELAFSVHVPITPRPPGRPGSGAVAETVPATALLVAPTRIDAVLAEAAERQLPVG